MNTPLHLRALDHLFLLRPMLMPPVWTIGLLGFQQGQRFSGHGTWTDAVIPILLFTLLIGGVYVQNQLHDIDTDRANHKLFLLADGYIPRRAAIAQMVICYGGAVALALLYARWLGVLMCGALVIGVLYNTPPFRWKDRPLEGLLSNLVVYGLVVFAVGWLSVAPMTQMLVWRAVPYACGVAAIYLNTTLPDISGDRLAGKITFGVKYGFRVSSTLAPVFLACGTLTGFLLDDPWIAIPSLCCLPLFVRMAVTGKVEDVARATKLGVLALSLAAVAVCPWYLLLLTALFFFGARPYYRSRFHLEYPTFRTR